MNHILLIVTCFIMHHYSDDKLVFTTSNTIQLPFTDTSHYTTLVFDKTRNYYQFDKNVKPTTLSYKEIIKIDSLTGIEVVSYNEKIERSYKEFEDNLRKRKKKIPFKTMELWNLITNYSKYYKQYIPVVNVKGEKEVWVNCFCPDYKASDWKKEPVLVLDGGACFFSLKINLTTNSIYYFQVHGNP